MEISLIVVDYCTMEQTLLFLERCRQRLEGWRQVSVVIVDNDPGKKGLESFLAACRDASLADKEETALVGKVDALWRGNLEERPVCFVRAGRNLGYARGNNLGALVASRIFAPRFYLISNNDIFFPAVFLLEALWHPMLRNQEVAGVGPAIVGNAGEAQNPGKYRKAGKALFGGYWNMLLPKKMQISGVSNVVSRGQEGFCDWVSGSFFLVDAAKFQEVDGFDCATFLYMEEIILSYRLRRRGYRVYYTDRAKVVHAHGRTVKSTIGELEGLRKSFASELYFYRAYEGLSAAAAGLARFSFTLFYGLFWCKKTLKKFFEDVKSLYGKVGKKD